MEWTIVFGDKVNIIKADTVVMDGASACFYVEANIVAIFKEYDCIYKRTQQ